MGFLAAGIGELFGAGAGLFGGLLGAGEAAGAGAGLFGAGEAGLFGAGEALGAGALGAGEAGALTGGFATAADLGAAGATGLAEGTGFATAADLIAPLSADAALAGGASTGFSQFYNPATGSFVSDSALPAGAGPTGFTPNGATLPGSNINTFGAPSSGVLPAGATAPGGASPVGLSSSGISGADPTLAATGDATSAATGGAGGVAGAAKGSGFSLESLLGSAGKSVMANPLGTALAAGGLGYNMLQGQKVSDAQKKLTEQAGQLNEQGQKLASYLLNGNLPPGLKASLDQATESAKARVRSNFAAQGMSTDPAKNTALAAEMDAIDKSAVISIAQIGQQLLGSGQAASGLSSSLYSTLANLDQTQTQRVGQSIANMAAALSPGGGKGGLTVNLGNSKAA